MMIKMLSSRALGAIASITGAISICLLTLPYYLFPQFYIPKANASMGYLYPVSIEGWTFLIVGFLLLCVTVILILWLKVRQKS